MLTIIELLTQSSSRGGKMPSIIISGMIDRAGSVQTDSSGSLNSVWRMYSELVNETSVSLISFTT